MWFEFKAKFPSAFTFCIGGVEWQNDHFHIYEYLPLLCNCSTEKNCRNTKSIKNIHDFALDFRSRTVQNGSLIDFLCDLLLHKTKKKHENWERHQPNYKFKKINRHFCWIFVGIYSHMIFDLIPLYNGGA